MGRLTVKRARFGLCISECGDLGKTSAGNNARVYRSKLSFIHGDILVEIKYFELKR